LARLAITAFHGNKLLRTMWTGHFPTKIASTLATPYLFGLMAIMA
jgi:hypothetical protein